MQETRVIPGRSPGGGMATHSSIAWEILWTEELGGLQSTGAQEPVTTQQLHTKTFKTLYMTCILLP